jgi:hypothetical protein
MGKTQEVNGAVAPAPRFLDDNRKVHQLLQRAPTQTHSKLDRQRTTENVQSYIHHIKEHAAAGIQNTITHMLGIFMKGRISRDCLTYVRYNEAQSNGHCKIKEWQEKFIGGLWNHSKSL